MKATDLSRRIDNFLEDAGVDISKSPASFALSIDTLNNDSILKGGIEGRKKKKKDSNDDGSQQWQWQQVDQAQMDPILARNPSDIP
jgi:hypothetical protein